MVDVMVVEVNVLRKGHVFHTVGRCCDEASDASGWSSDLRGLLVDGMYNIAVADVQVRVVASAQCKKDPVIRSGECLRSCLFELWSGKGT